MDLDKATIFNIAIVIHMALTGLALIQLFKLKTTTGGVIIITFLGLMIPILGPSALIIYFKNINKKNAKMSSQKPQQGKQRIKNKKLPN